MKVSPLSLCMITNSEQLDILLSRIDETYIIHHRREMGGDKETIDYVEREIKQLVASKNWPRKMKKAR